MNELDENIYNNNVRFVDESERHTYAEK